MAAWTLPGLSVMFGPSRIFFFWVGLINKSCVSVMAVLKFLLCLYLIFFFNFCKLRLLKTCYCSMKLQQYFLYKSGSISYLLYT